MKKSLLIIRKFLIITMFTGTFMLNSAAFAEDTKEENIVPVMDIKGGVQKEEITQKLSLFQTWIRQDSITGDWKGLRPWLEEKGITLEGEYISEGFFKGTGGLNHKNPLKAFGKVSTSLTLDTEKASLWKGGKAFVSFENLHGSGLTERYVGDIQTLSSIDTQPYAQLNEYFLEQKLLKDIITLKVGRQDANSDFCALDNASDFLNSSFGLIPNVPIPTYPAPGMGVAGYISLNDKTEIKYGFFDGDAQPKSAGFKTVFDGKSGAVHVTEIYYSPEIKSHKGKYIAGYWYHSGDVEEISSAEEPRTFSGNQGFYTGFDQAIYIENKEDDQGLNLIGQFGWSPSDRTEISKYYGVGLAYKGLIPKRNEDVTGIGSAFADLSKRYKDIDGRTMETALELYHKFQLTPWFALQPDMQLIFNPGGNGKNSLVFGLRSIFRI